jgi:hypothetical protein
MQKIAFLALFLALQHHNNNADTGFKHTHPESPNKIILSVCFLERGEGVVMVEAEQKVMSLSRLCCSAFAKTLSTRNVSHRSCRVRRSSKVTVLLH